MGIPSRRMPFTPCPQFILGRFFLGLVLWGSTRIGLRLLRTAAGTLAELKLTITRPEFSRWRGEFQEHAARRLKWITSKAGAL